jgi:hypothetical protein
VKTETIQRAAKIIVYTSRKRELNTINVLFDLSELKAECPASIVTSGAERSSDEGYPSGGAAGCRRYSTRLEPEPMSIPLAGMARRRTDHEGSARSPHPDELDRDYNVSGLDMSVLFERQNPLAKSASDIMFRSPFVSCERTSGVAKSGVVLRNSVLQHTYSRGQSSQQASPHFEQEDAPFVHQPNLIVTVFVSV